ncbi:MAG: sensor histidine kinase [Pyrinomonadaceae bacterium]
MIGRSNMKVARYVLAVLGIVVATGLLTPLRGRINTTTVALALLLVVLFAAARWGSRPALLASVAGMFCFNYFFLPPVGTLTIADPDNWIALAAFLVVALTAGQLSARARRRAEEAEAGRHEIERLYRELREAFERASHAEALRQSEKLKSVLLDAVTHDIRTPLTSIKASVTTLLDEAHGITIEGRPLALGAEARRDMLEVIDEESDRLSRFVEGLVELARIEAGELRLRRRWGAVDEIVATALERAKPLTRGRRLSVSIERELPMARVDPRAVGEVVYTLVDNAAKYSPAGSAIRIAARQSAEEMVEIAVEDEGPGVTPQLRERVFDKFFRAVHEGDIADRQPSGTGMGLSIAKGIVEAHGGRIWVEDGADGNGARFVFTLPIGDEEESPGAPRGPGAAELSPADLEVMASEHTAKSS